MCAFWIETYFGPPSSGGPQSTGRAYRPKAGPAAPLAVVTVACKGISDQVLSGSWYAQIGGVRLSELRHHERRFLLHFN